MKITSEIKSVPTFKQYIKLSDSIDDRLHPITLVLCSEEWRTITFFTEEFKLNHKVANEKEYNTLYRNVSKVLNKECTAYLQITSGSTCDIIINVASDGNEDFHKFKSTDRGWEKIR